MENTRPRRRKRSSRIQVGSELERDIKRRIMIETSDRVVWFNNPVGIAQDGMRRLRYGCGGKGASDLLGILRDGSGRFVACEVKRPGKKPTKEQERFIALVRRADGIAFVAKSIEDVNQALDAQMKPATEIKIKP